MSMLACAEPTYLAGRIQESVLEISKVVAKFVLSAGVAILVHFAETRTVPLFSFQNLIGASPWPAIRSSEDLGTSPKLYLQIPARQASESHGLDKRPSDKLDPVSLIYEGYKQQPEVYRSRAFKGYLIGLFVCLSLALGVAIHTLSTDSRGFRLRWTTSGNSFPLSHASRLPSLVADAPLDGLPEPSRGDPIVPGAFVDTDTNDSKDWFIARGGPPPPPPPPTFTSSMQNDDKWNIDWISILLLLPIVISLLKRLFGWRKGFKRTVPIASTKTSVTGAHEIHETVLPLRLREQTSPAGSTPSDSWSFAGARRENQTRIRLHNQAPYPSNLERRFIKFLFMLGVLAVSSTLPLIALLLVVTAWFYLPDVILRFLVAKDTVGLTNTSKTAAPQSLSPLKGRSDMTLGDATVAKENKKLSWPTTNDTTLEWWGVPNI